MRRLTTAFLFVCLLFVPAASGASKDRVQVGRPGQNATEGHPLALFVAVELLPEYQPSNRFDGDARSWEGPEYRAAGLESRKATVD